MEKSSKTRISGKLLHNDPAESPDASEDSDSADGSGDSDGTDETPGNPDETPGNPDETPGNPDETPGNPDETPGNPDETPGNPDETPGNPDETPGGSDETPKPDEKPSTPNEGNTVGGAVVDIITSGLDSAAAQINRIQDDLVDSLNDVKRPTAAARWTIWRTTLTTWTGPLTTPPPPRRMSPHKSGKSWAKRTASGMC